MQKVVLIDDDFTTCFLLENKISSNQFSFETYNSGLDFIEKINQYPSSSTLILLDVNMPLLNGFGVATKLKEDYSFDMSKIVVLTNEAPIIEDFRKIGVVKFEEKVNIDTSLIENML